VVLTTWHAGQKIESLLSDQRERKYQQAFLFVGCRAPSWQARSEFIHNCGGKTGNKPVDNSPGLPESQSTQRHNFCRAVCTDISQASMGMTKKATSMPGHFLLMMPAPSFELPQIMSGGCLTHACFSH
jgi:hypothetical protein